MTLPTPVFQTAPEPFAHFDETECDPVVRPGVQAFADFVVAHQGGISGRIVQSPCSSYPSGHNSGRAWDWAVRAVAGEREIADELIGWLLANDAALARRAGVVYLIWDKKIWSGTKGWHPYDGYGELGNCISPPCRNAHCDHVHFSFSRAGSEGQTSFYDWLRGGQAVPAQAHAASSAPLIWLSGLVAGYVGAELYCRRQRQRARRTSL